MLISTACVILAVQQVYARPGSPSDWEPIDVPESSPAVDYPGSGSAATPVSQPGTGPGTLSPTSGVHSNTGSGGSNPLLTTSMIAEPGSGDDSTECTNTNITPTDLPTYRDGATTDKRQVVYTTTPIPGYYQNPSSPNSLQGQIFGPKGSNANSWDICVPQCFEWCANNASCHSFNVFTFEQSDWNSCEPTCECRPVKRTYNPNDYSIHDPLLGHDFPSIVFDAKVYCFNETCCFNPYAETYDRCLWEAAGVRSYIEHYYDGNPEDASQRNIIRDIYREFTNATAFYDCNVATNLDCPDSFATASYNSTPGSITAYLAFLALRRQVRYMRAASIYWQDVVDNVNNDADYGTNAIEAAFLTQLKNPQPTTADISGGFSIAAAAIAIVAVLAPEIAVPATIFSELIGLGSLADFSKDYEPVSADSQHLQTYLSAISKNTTQGFINASIQLKQNVTFALQLVDQFKGAALTLVNDPTWIDPTVKQASTARLLREWCISQVLKQLGVFAHWECTCQAPSLDYYNCLQYPGQTFPTGTNGFTYPVYYYVDSDSMTPNQVRSYAPVTNLAKWNLTWESVAMGAKTCFDARFPDLSSGQQWGPYPSDPSTSANLANELLNQPPNVATKDILCFWDLPVCDAGNRGLTSQCDKAQCDCVLYKGTPVGCNFGCLLCNPDVNPISADEDIARAGADNFGLDDWCARTLGQKGLSGSKAWPPGNRQPFGQGAQPGCQGYGQ